MLRIRDATPDDAAEIVRMTGLLCLHEGKPLPDFTVNDFRRDGFGSDPAFHTLVAERDNKLVGYVLYYGGYDVETAKRGLHIADLFVLSTERGKGVGKTLIREVARVCEQNGGRWVQWFCQKANTIAFEFYSRLGARLEDDAVSFCLGGVRLASLLDETS
jgi:ribosomal protein S18 acetylase RimI-like enzyme